MQLVFASSNKNKISEISAMLPVGWSILGLHDIGITNEIPEPGSTIKENSFLKAEYVRDFLMKNGRDIPVFADDSGLEVRSLGGAPGVHSARYAGEPKSDEANNTKLISELKVHNDRSARFVTVITFIDKNEVRYFEGHIDGDIIHEPRGKNGFGYDPLFIPEGSNRTFAEFEAAEKNAVSHRARAVRLFIDFINSRTT